ncbi:MAG: flagellar motor protein MotB [Enterocloster sp.]
MKNRRKNREAFGEHSYWQSYSDMMAALLLVFVLIIAITPPSTARNRGPGPGQAGS